VDRQIVFPGSIPLDTDLLSIQRNVMIGLGYLAQATLGGVPLVDGLACTPTVPASLTVTVGPGSITAPETIDSTAFGSLPADSADPLVKMGINTTPTTFTLTAPTTSGQTINYLIQAALLETDATPVVLPYYNAANPAQPFSGPDNTGVAQNTQRLQNVQLQLKPGAPANAGSQITPTVDSGWVGLYVVTVNYGQSQITSADIATLPTAPFVQFKLNNLAPGFSRMTTLYSSANFVVPNGVSRLKVRVCGGGGGGGGGASGLGGAGGGAGGYTEAVIQVTPGATIPVTVGAGGAGAPGTGLGGTGGTSSFGTYLSATGGGGGESAATYAAGGAPGTGSGGTMVAIGGFGSDGNGGTVMFAGNGGASAFGGGGRAAAPCRQACQAQPQIQPQPSWPRPRRRAVHHRGARRVIERPARRLRHTGAQQPHPALARRCRQSAGGGG